MKIKQWWWLNVERCLSDLIFAILWNPHFGRCGAQICQVALILLPFWMIELTASSIFRNWFLAMTSINPFVPQISDNRPLFMMLNRLIYTHTRLYDLLSRSYIHIQQSFQQHISQSLSIAIKLIWSETFCPVHIQDSLIRAYALQK